MGQKTNFYRTGHVNVTNGSPNVTGLGTRWLTYAEAGWKFAIEGGGTLYTVQSITDNVNLTLAANYAEPSNSGVKYGIIDPAMILPQITYSQNKNSIENDGADTVIFTGLPEQTSIMLLRPNGTRHQAVADSTWSATTTVAGLHIVIFIAPSKLWGVAAFSGA